MPVDKCLLEFRVVIGDRHQSHPGGIVGGFVCLQLYQLPHAVGTPVEGTAGNENRSSRTGKLFQQRDFIATV